MNARAAAHCSSDLLARNTTWSPPSSPFCCRYFVGRLLDSLSKDLTLDEELEALRGLLTSKSRCYDKLLTPRDVLDEQPWLLDVSPPDKGAQRGSSQREKGAAGSAGPLAASQEWVAAAPAGGAAGLSAA